jgi:hypothetical protein
MDLTVRRLSIAPNLFHVFAHAPFSSTSRRMSASSSSLNFPDAGRFNKMEARL